MKVLMIDNYDSFTYNLVYMLRQMELEVDVFRNDHITPERVNCYNSVVISPGPGLPDEAGNVPAILQQCAGNMPILGICLGHQAIATYLGAKLHNKSEVCHGIQAPIHILDKTCPLFENTATKLFVGRYHSWEVSRHQLPSEIEVTAEDERQSIMAIKNESLQLYGLQFHPESILTPDGAILIQNFINCCQ